MTQGKQINRRRFLLTTGAVASAPLFIPSSVFASQERPGANERLRMGFIGFGGRSNGLYKEMRKSGMDKYVDVVAVCDVDEKRLESGLKQLGQGVTPYRDYRYILERKDVDAVVIGTPDHWHGVQVVHAADCGKHIYVEKPACCTIEEGRAMVAAQKRNPQVAIQVGSQGRSQPEAYLAHRYLVNGNIGHIGKVWCFHYASPADNSPVADSEPPAELDWDLWLGPMRWRPYNRRYLPGSFRWMMESGGGQIRDRGAHVMSCAMHWMGADGTGPVEVEATDVRFPTRGAWDAAIDMVVTYTFKNPDWVMIWDQQGRELNPKAPFPTEPDDVSRISRPGYGAVYHGDKGTFTHWGGDGGTWSERKAREWKPGAGAKEVYESPGHWEDWFECIKDPGRKPIMNIEAAVGVANLTILGNLSAVLGRKLQWDQAKQTIVGDQEAQRMMSRPQRYPYVL